MIVRWLGQLVTRCCIVSGSTVLSTNFTLHRGLESRRYVRTQTFLAKTTGQELVKVSGIVRVASQLQVGTVLEDLLRLCGHKGRLLLVER